MLLLSLLLLLSLFLFEVEEEVEGEEKAFPLFLLPTPFFLLCSLARALEAPASTPAAKAEMMRAPTRETSSPEEERREAAAAAAAADAVAVEEEEKDALVRNLDASARAVATSEAIASSLRPLPQPPAETTAWSDLARVDRQAAEPEAPAAAAAASPKSAPRRARSAGASAAPRARAAVAGGAEAAASTEQSISDLARHHAASVDGHKCSGGGE